MRERPERRFAQSGDVRLSMGRKGNCVGNAVAEAFFGTLKTEHVD